MEAAITTKKFTIDEYHQMVNAGILSEEDRVELIHGEIVEVGGTPLSPPGDNHTKTVRRINKLLNTKLPDYIIDQQNPIKIAGHSEPEPDLVVLPFRDDFYPNGVTLSPDFRIKNL
ncbi:MAG: Uma2 family endonuclease [Cyclobacteriaceae bacterium]